MAFVRCVTALFVLVACIAHCACAAATREQTEAAAAYKTAQDVRKCLTVVSASLRKYRSARKSLDRAEYLLRGTCDGMQDRLKMWDTIKLFFRSVKKVPLGSFPRVSGVVEQGSSTIQKSLRGPTKSVCRVMTKIRSKLEPFDKSKKGKVFNSVAKAMDRSDKFLATAEDVLEMWEMIKNRKATVCPSIVKTYKSLVEMKKSCERIAKPLMQIERKFNAASVHVNEKVVDPVNALKRVLHKISRGPLGTIGSTISTIQRTKIELPRVRSKSRGVGKVPACCPRGYVNTAGLCYKSCTSGWETLGLVCMKRCRRGYGTAGPTCIKKKFPWKPYVRETRARLGQLPAVFGNRACACRRDGRRYLEAGLCHHKCGRDRFVGYKTAVLTECWDTGLKTFRVQDLVSQLSLFDKIEKVPGIKQILSVANRVISKALQPIEKLSTKLFGIKVPRLNLDRFDIDLKVPDIAQALIDKVLAFASKVPVVDFDSNGLCVDVSL